MSFSINLRDAFGRIGVSSSKIELFWIEGRVLPERGVIYQEQSKNSLSLKVTFIFWSFESLQNKSDTDKQLYWKSILILMIKRRQG